MADLIARKVFRFAGKTYAHHWYNNGDMWLIVASDTMITARLIVPDGRAHHIERGSMTITDQSTEPRPLHEIAADIRANWPKIYFGAEPYIHAMESLGKISESYGYDKASDIVRYFLSNASTWRGEDARRIKAELQYLLKRG